MKRKLKYKIVNYFTLIHNYTTYYLNIYFIITDPINHGASTSKSQPIKFFMFNSSSNDPATPTNPKKVNTENLQLAECIGDVRALLIEILCDEIPSDMEAEGYDYTREILDECHTTFLSCFNAFYPTSTLKWNCLCELLIQKDKVKFCNFNLIIYLLYIYLKNYFVH